MYYICSKIQRQNKSSRG